MASSPTAAFSELKTDASFFDKDYFESGISSLKSNYEDYKFLPDLTLQLALYIKRFMGIKDGDSALDYGAAKGYLVKALRMMSVTAYGFDISEYAIANCDPSVKGFVSNELKADPMSYDFVIAKDVMEHLTKEQLQEVLPKLWSAARKAMLIIVPLTGEDGGPYLCPKDEKDSSHKIRWTLTGWLQFLTAIDRRSVVLGTTYVPEIKQSNVAWEGSCGFFLLRRFL